MGARYIDGVFFNVFGVFVISWLTQSVNVSRGQALGGVMAAAIIMCFFIPYFGRMSDRLGRTRVYFWGAIVSGISAFPAFWLMMTSGGNPLEIGRAHV